MRIACLAFFVFAQVAHAQSFPDAASLLRREAEVLDGYATYSYVEETSASTGAQTASGAAAGGGGLRGLTMPIDVRQTTTITAMNPGKRRMVVQMGGQELTLLVSDGQNTWLYMPTLNQYAQLPDATGIMDAFGGAAGIAAATAGMTARVLRSERLDVDGTSRDCWVVESRLDGVALGGISMRGAVTTSWIDKTLGFAWRRTTLSQVEGMLPAGTQVTSVTNRRALVVNGPVPESAFVFTPPAGARRDDNFLTTVLGAIAAPAARPAWQEPGAAAPASPDQPQAFVPSLTPIDSVEPEWPSAAKEKGTQGIVEVLVTLDAQGTVIKAEALTGPQVLRAAAETAVRQSRFHPVVRQGRQVPAYTTQVVPFLDYSRPVTPELNIGEEVAAQRRLDELSQRWPRSKKDEFLDLENDQDGQPVEARRFFLPQLAKAAWDAGDIDKAEFYAQSALATVTPDTLADGEAVHDAHMVLGLVAMKAGHIALARQHLLEAGHTRGGGSLNSFGPDLTLAQQLLNAGEKDAVLEYLTLCETFWQSGRAQLREWRAAIESGGKPTLNRFVVLQKPLPAS